MYPRRSEVAVQNNIRLDALPGESVIFRSTDHSGRDEDGKEYYPTHDRLLEVLNKVSRMPMIACLTYVVPFAEYNGRRDTESESRSSSNAGQGACC